MPLVVKTSVVALKQENRILRTENARLKRELLRYEHHTGTKTGADGERFIQTLFPHGKPTGTHSQHDLEVKKCLIEIKTSGCLSNGNNTTHRKWVWHKFKGSSGKKRYHLLVLVGAADPEFQHRYRDPECDFVIFAIRHQGINSFRTAVKGGTMSLGTNKDTVQSRSFLKRKLWEKYEVTRKELKRIVRDDQCSANLTALFLPLVQELDRLLEPFGFRR